MSASPRFHFVVATNGSFGDVFPFIAIARALHERGHDVQLVTNPAYAHLAGDVPFVPASTREALDQSIDRLDVSRARSPRHLSQLMDGFVIGPTEEFLEAILSVIQPERSVVLSFPLTFGARLAHDITGVPFVTAQLAPAGIASARCPPRMMPSRWLGWMPTPVVRAVHFLVDRVLDRMVLPTLNPLRARHGLSKTRNVREWMDSPERILALFPQWFAPPAPDEAATVRRTDFPLLSTNDTLADPTLQAFLAAGPKPVVFTAGSPASGVSAFFSEAVACCVQTQTRGILLTRHASDVPEALPETVLHVSFTSLDQLLEQASALVFHGGIGTAAQALRAGTPMVVVPWGVDQFDNADHLCRLGVAREVRFENVTAQRLAEALQALTLDPTVQERCTELAARFPADPLASTCEALEAFARTSRARSGASAGR